MGLMTRLSLRNLFRQKRRNFFLGLGITFGMMILVIANSFSNGVVDVLINDITAYAFGHLVIEGIPGNSSFKIIRDRPYIEALIKESVKPDDLLHINENLSIMVHAVGNGEEDNIGLAGYTPQNIKNKDDFFYNKSLSIVQGDYREYFSTKIQYPVIVSEEIVKSLNVKIHDVIWVSLPMITGQVQTAPLTVVGIVHSSNSLMSLVVFLDVNRLKALVGYKPWESSSVQLTLKNPQQTAPYYSDILTRKLQPGLLTITGKVGGEDCRILAFKNDEKSKKLIQRAIRLTGEDPEQALGKNGVMITPALARKLGLQTGREFTYQYQTKYRGLHQETLKVTAIYESVFGDNTILVNGETIYDIYNKFLPEKINVQPVAKTNPLYPALATAWELFPRSKDSQDLWNKYKQNRMQGSHQAKFDVVTMFEGASDILLLKNALNMVTFIAVLFLFFIILIGVVNMLRMTIRERTREIGTVRAIGMRKSGVLGMFIMETLFLTAFSCIAGIILGIITIQFLEMIPINVDNALSMILKGNHLAFKLDLGGILNNFFIIMLIAGITAYFPARRAAKLSAVEALSHYE